jgi:predicted amidohydrolase YtcJ
MPRLDLAAIFEMYTTNPAFMASDDDKRGTLEAGKLADLAVLSADYLTAPTAEIGKIRSLLTMVGGKVVCADAPFAGFETPETLAVIARSKATRPTAQ